MEDSELIALQKEEKELVQKIKNAREKLAKRGKEHQHAHSNSNLLLRSDNHNAHLKEDSPETFDQKILNIAHRFLGISFEDCNRKWLHDNYYLYKTLVKSKGLNFYLDISVYLRDNRDFKIDLINCDFINVEKYSLNEILPWVEKICIQKNLSLLLSAVNEYNEKAIIRSKVLSKVTQEKYGSLEECEDEKGGVIIYIHSPSNPKEIYLKLHWVLLFSEWSLQIVHFFIINTTDTGQGFAKANQSLLQNFCASNISKTDLLELWNSLFTEVDTYESNK